ncbi:hypothetical protein EDD86DRAFT_3982 [Gorgonomyces haynaldii]|nr:hypothetical protein EDD86DRAFT_3982 [Gorgonomyces haynaldii]
MLYDAQSSPTVPWLELLATCYIPLVRVLLSSKKPLSVVFKMSTLSHVSEHLLPRLEIALFDLTQERFTWAKFVDNVPIMEEVWQAQFEDKIAQDLGKRSSWIPSFHYTDTTPSLVYTLLSTTIKGLRELFRHRHFRFIGVDEFKQFRFLTSFVQSINPKVLGLNNMLEIASAVADIPYLGPRVNHTMHERFHGSTLISSWNTKGVVGSYVSETFYEPIGSPATMIGRRYGSLQEHAILLCSLFKGLGVKAYVTVGEIKRRRYIWVTTITEREKATELIGLDVSPAKENELYQQTQFYDDHGGEPVTFDGFGFKKKDTVQSNAQFRRVYDVLQWDPISGNCFDSRNVL